MMILQTLKKVLMIFMIIISAIKIIINQKFFGVPYNNRNNKPFRGDKRSSDYQEFNKEN